MSPYIAIFPTIFYVIQYAGKVVFFVCLLMKNGTPMYWDIVEQITSCSDFLLSF